MTAQMSFTSEEWRTLQFAPLWTFSAVAGADANIDEQELTALDREITSGELYKEQLVREILSSIATDALGVLAEYTADGRTVDHGLSQAADVVERHLSPEESDRFKQSMLVIGHEIAKASGPSIGDKVSNEEKHALAGCALALRVSLD
jgi:hypothetical protein